MCGLFKDWLGLRISDAELEEMNAQADEMKGETLKAETARGPEGPM